MGIWQKRIRFGVQTALLTVLPSVSAIAQGPTGQAGDRGPLREPVYRVPAQQQAGQGAAQHGAQAERVAQANPAKTRIEVAAANEHPLMPAIRLAKERLDHIDAKVQDYSCTLVKRENVDGTIGEHEFMFLKVRHEPFSVYIYFLAPANLKGRECIYVAGANENKLVAHEGGGRLKAMLPTVNLDPNSMMAMRNQRYPITEIGVRNLTARLVEVAEQDSRFGECEVKYFEGAKISDRVCTCIQVMHPVPRKEFRYHLARVFIDDELQIPVRFESYDWPDREGAKPILLEEYTYTNVKLNNGFTDADFDRSNQNYRFDRKKN